MRKMVRASTGGCPYCGGGLSPVTNQPLREDELTMHCGSCLRFSTEREGNGKVYPHDDPSDVSSPIATAVYIEV